MDVVRPQLLLQDPHDLRPALVGVLLHEHARAGLGREVRQAPVQGGEERLGGVALLLSQVLVSVVVPLLADQQLPHAAVERVQLVEADLEDGEFECMNYISLFIWVLLVPFLLLIYVLC